jgi:hypothetical protein
MTTERTLHRLGLSRMGRAEMQESLVDLNILLSEIICRLEGNSLTFGER